MEKLGWMLMAAGVAFAASHVERATAGHAPRLPGCALKLEVLTEFVSGQDIPESVTTDDAGNLYVSVGSSIVRRTPNGTVGVFATLPLAVFALGLKVGADGCLYVASTSLSETPGAYVWRSCGPDSVEVFAELDHAGAPNDLAFDRQGNLFVTDPVLARVWKLDSSGNPEVFAEHPLLAGNPEDPALLFRALGVNGIALDRQARHLYLSNTDQGSIVRIRLTDSAGTPAIYVQDELLLGADGVAFDRAGRLWVAVNARDALVLVDRRRHVYQLAQAAPLDAPSSIVFGAGQLDRHSVYITSSAFSRTLGLSPGTPAPALLVSEVLVPGLPL